MAERAFCVHGHFYQPPREDPLTNEIPLEPGAAPYHNWNERIHYQCYKPNANLGNFERISFNIGPTLLEWMEDYDPQTLAKIVAQNQRNVDRYGVGNAMAQAYNHTILPYSSRVDKMTQVRWGIADYEWRFGNKPAGMWLPEAAVDEETLEVLAECGIEFTILAPWQAEGPIDPDQPYRVDLPSGRSIIVFFYDQDLSTMISFDPGSTINADDFYKTKVLQRFIGTGQLHSYGQVVMIASDGELYGHHQPFRDKFLEHLTDGAIREKRVKATYPGLWLRRHPVKETVKIRQNTSWSCLHGITRWGGSCSCTPHPSWKAPLRRALDSLAKSIDEEYLRVVQYYLEDPWELRHDYILILKGETTTKQLLEKLSGRKLAPEEVHKVELLLNAQYERQRMFTSCGWFFDDFDRIEPRNNINYAAQAVYLTYLATGIDLGEQAVAMLSKVKSWRSGLHADQVFSHHLERARNNQGGPVWAAY